MLPCIYIVHYSNTLVFSKYILLQVPYNYKEAIMFGDVIKNLRLSHNLNQVQLANDLNVSKQTISNWENNNILPSIEMLVKISYFFSVSTDVLLEIDQRKYLEITGLSDKQLSHLQALIDDIRISTS